MFLLLVKELLRLLIMESYISLPTPITAKLIRKDLMVLMRPLQGLQKVYY